MRFRIAAVPSIGRAVRVERPGRDADATQDLYERYAAQILGFCVNQLGSRDEAEDAVQSTFLNAHRALQRGVTPDAELPWLFKIAHNVCLTRRRSTRRRTRVESPSDLGAVQDVLPAPPRESADELMRLTDALEDMPSSQRRAIVLREWRGLSYHEIAEELKLSQSAVETLIFRARRTLASKLRTENDRPRPLSRIRKAFDAGALLTGLKTLFEGGAAAKVAVVAVAASGTAVAVTVPHHHAQKGHPPKKVAAANVQHPAKAAAAVPAASSKHVRRAKKVRAASHAAAKPAAGLTQTGAQAAAQAEVPAATVLHEAPTEAAVDVAAPEQAKTPPGQAKKLDEPEPARGRDNPKPKDMVAAAPEPAEPPVAEPETPAAEHGPPADPGNAEKDKEPKK